MIPATPPARPATLKYSKKWERALKTLYRQKDVLWLIIWLAGLGTLALWDVFFLNKPAFQKLQQGIINTFLAALLVIFLTLFLGWAAGVGHYFLGQLRHRPPYLAATFLLNLIRSIPQIVGILIGYALITLGIQNGALSNPAVIIFLTAFTISLFVFPEIVDLIRERIAYFRQRDFYNAMRVCGISEQRIINREILLKNSLPHIFNKLISIFGVTVFLLCSIDFIVSVGLSGEISAVNLPATLGSLLANIDSKQDILAIGHTLTHPGYFPNLFFEHLQGVSVAFVIVFSLLCIYKIANGFAQRHEL